MKTAIIFATHHGTTELVANVIGEQLINDFVDLINIDKMEHIDLTPYQRVIIGGSIHAGMIQKSIREFCSDNLEILLSKQVGLFICGMNDNQWEQELENAFPEKLRNHSDSNRIMGGEFKIEEMNIVEKFLVKKITGVGSSVSNILHDQIEQLVADLEEAVHEKA